MRSVGRGALLGAGLLATGLLGGCSLGGRSGDGTGGGGSPAVSFSFASSAATLAESDGPASVQVVLHAMPPVLEADVTVDVADAGTGTAIAATDYAAFATRTITFPAGAHAGDMQAALLDPLDDLLVEGASETVHLRLQDPSAGAQLGTAQFAATLTDIHAAVVAFAAAGSTTPDEASDLRAVALELDCGAGVTLGVPASILVSDLHTGSAGSSSDYAFPAKTVTFPAGRADGAIKTVNVQVLDDGAIEGDETVKLGLSQPSSTCSLGALVTHELTIRDDDLAASATFLASEGASGTQNPLADDELVPLGSQAVGAGPNAGTLLRVANGGATAMHLSVPRLTGSHPNDFAVEVEASSAPFVPGAPGSSRVLSSSSGQPGKASEPGWSLALPDEPSPMIAVAGDAGPGLAFRLDAAAIAHLGTLERVALHDFPLPDLGPVTLELERRRLPVSADAKLVIDGQEIEGGVRVLASDLQVWRGDVAGMPGSRVFLALSGTGAHGFLELPFLPDRLVHMTTDGLGQIRLLRDTELAALGFEPPQDFCAGERFVPGQPLIQQQLGGPDGPSTSALTVADCTLALETDFQLFQKFGSSVAVTNYVTALIGAESDQYFTDVQTTLSIAYLGIHTTSNDGWNAQEGLGGVDGLLNEFRAAWSSGWPVQADLAHFLSGALLGGGTAFVNVLCNPSLGFGVSANLSGAIDWSTWTGQAGGFTWDFYVLAHELGHNFGSLHTFEYCPPLDRCISSCLGPSICSRGTLMSYCHICGSGGLANIDLRFHPVTAAIMRERVNASCLDDAALLGGDFVQYRVRFNPLSTTGARSATLEFTHDAANVPQPFRVRLSGTAN